MEALEAIRTRRMLPRVHADLPPRERIEELLELAVRAPTHHQTEPWRFIVLAGKERDRLARVIADEASSRGADRAGAEADAAGKVERAPVLIVCTCDLSRAKAEDKVYEQEEIVSAAMAMQNMLIGAPDLGLGVMLRTGPAAYHASAAEHLELGPDEVIVGILYVGLPAADRAQTPRAQASERTRWLGWPQA